MLDGRTSRFSHEPPASGAGVQSDDARRGPHRGRDPASRRTAPSRSIGSGRSAGYLVENGSDGVVVTGTTGEAPTLTDDERFALYEVALDEVGDTHTVVAGTGTYDTAHSVHLTERAHEIGVHGFLVVTPYYNKPPQRGIVAHVEAIAAATDRPIVFYDIPSRVVVDAEPAHDLGAGGDPERPCRQAGEAVARCRAPRRRVGARPLRRRRRPDLPVPRGRRRRRHLRPHARRRAAGEGDDHALPRGRPRRRAGDRRGAAPRDRAAPRADQPDPDQDGAQPARSRRRRLPPAARRRDAPKRKRPSAAASNGSACCMPAAA